MNKTNYHFKDETDHIDTDSGINHTFAFSNNVFNEIKEAISGLKHGELIMKNPIAFE